MKKEKSQNNNTKSIFKKEKEVTKEEKKRLDAFAESSVEGINESSIKKIDDVQ
ncbi:MAG: hypothetical protein K9M44_02390 [Candidatus Pacebacteria bacterium]|nr:hypothetical protein [Candidatus Paceibacterota bacterium]